MFGGDSSFLRHSAETRNDNFRFFELGKGESGGSAALPFPQKIQIKHCHSER